MRTLAIVSAAALVGGIAGAAIGIAVDGGRGRGRPRSGPVAREPTSVAHAPQAGRAFASEVIDHPARPWPGANIETITPRVARARRGAASGCASRTARPPAKTSRSATCRGSRAAYHE
jgi:hypothetical protein